MDPGYLILPFVSWFIAGTTKFVINSVAAKRLAFNKIGYGGLPSNHSAIVSAIVVLIALREGIADPVFGVALTLAFIVILDAGGLRKHIASQARSLNKLSSSKQGSEMLRESIGHSKLEIFAGIVVGVVSALLVNSISS